MWRLKEALEEVPSFPMAVGHLAHLFDRQLGAKLRQILFRQASLRRAPLEQILRCRRRLPEHPVLSLLKESPPLGQLTRQPYVSLARSTWPDYGSDE